MSWEQNQPIWMLWCGGRTREGVV